MSAVPNGKYYHFAWFLDCKNELGASASRKFPRPSGINRNGPLGFFGISPLPKFVTPGYIC